MQKTIRRAGEHFIGLGVSRFDFDLGLRHCVLGGIEHQTSSTLLHGFCHKDSFRKARTFPQIKHRTNLGRLPSLQISECCHSGLHGTVHGVWCCWGFASAIRCASRQFLYICTSMYSLSCPSGLAARKVQSFSSEKKVW